jgi:DNA-directed RNA polymerase subunit F
MLPTLKHQDFELTMEQQFTLVRYTQQVEEIPPEKLRVILLEILRQLMIKNNLLRALVRKS